MTTEQIDELSMKAKKRVKEAYSWGFIADQYESFIGKIIELCFIAIAVRYSRLRNSAVDEVDCRGTRERENLPDCSIRLMA